MSQIYCSTVAANTVCRYIVTIAFFNSKKLHPFGKLRKGVFIYKNIKYQNVDLVFILKTQLRAGLIFFVGEMKALCL